MNRSHSLRNIEKPDAKTLLVQVVKPDIIVYSGISELDRLLGGFKAGEITLVDGDSELISDLPNRLCVNTYRMFQGGTVYIDGGMCADPYRIARYARMLELDQREVLDQVMLSRAFTVYQLSTLLHDLLEPILKTLSPRTLIIGMFPALYSDPDVSSREAHTLFCSDLQRIQELTRAYQLITVVTHRDAVLFSTRRGLGNMLSSLVDEIVRMKQFEQCTSIELVKHQKTATIVRFAKGQLCLEEFGMVS